MGKILSFTDLLAWQEGHKLVLAVYTMTKTLPESERFGLVSQSQRAAVSVTSNIAEGFGCRGEKEKVQFYYIAHGSLTELHNQLLIMRDTDLIKENVFADTLSILETTNKLLLGLIRSIHAA